MTGLVVREKGDKGAMTGSVGYAGDVSELSAMGNLVCLVVLLRTVFSDDTLESSGAVYVCAM